MTRDSIMDATVRFIRANERNLQLALRVEEALPEVRTELAEEFFKCVEKRLKEKVETTEEWEIRATGTEGLWMGKKSWDQLKVGENSEDWWGIRLLHKSRGWDPSISVANIEETSENVKEEMRNEFCKYIGEPKTDQHYIWLKLKDNENFESVDFLKKMINEEKRKSVVKDMTEKLAELALAVDGVLSNSG